MNVTEQHWQTVTIVAGTGSLWLLCFVGSVRHLRQGSYTAQAFAMYSASAIAFMSSLVWAMWR